MFSLVTLWAAELAATAGKLRVLGAACYKKPEPTFADCLAAVRRILWAEEAVSPILWRGDYLTLGEHPRTPGKTRVLPPRPARAKSYPAFSSPEAPEYRVRCGDDTTV